jgi:hypothetical protein
MSGTLVALPAQASAAGDVQGVPRIATAPVPASTVPASTPALPLEPERPSGSEAMPELLEPLDDPPLDAELPFVASPTL